MTTNVSSLIDFVNEQRFIYKVMLEEGLTRKECINIFSQRIFRSITKSIIEKKSTNHTKLQEKIYSILGHKMYLDSNDAQYLGWNRIYEPFETFVMKSLIKPNGRVLDLGGFIGYYTLIFRRAVGGNGKVYVFEPRPSNVKLLKKNLELNGYPYCCDSSHGYMPEHNGVVIVEQKAVSAENGKVMLYLSSIENEGMNRIYKSRSFDIQNDTIEVDSVTLDTYFRAGESHHSYENNKHIDFVKMDLEGSEFGALKGMKHLIKEPENKNMKIVTEFHPPSILEYGIEPKEVIELLRAYGFNIFMLDRRTKSKRLINNSDVSNLIDIASKDTTNLLCMRSER